MNLKLSLYTKKSYALLCWERPLARFQVIVYELKCNVWSLEKVWKGQVVARLALSLLLPDLDIVGGTAQKQSKTNFPFQLCFPRLWYQQTHGCNTNKNTICELFLKPSAILLALPAALWIKWPACCSKSCTTALLPAQVNCSFEEHRVMWQNRVVFRLFCSFVKHVVCCGRIV